MISHKEYRNYYCVDIPDEYTLEMYLYKMKEFGFNIDRNTIRNKKRSFKEGRNKLNFFLRHPKKDDKPSRAGSLMLGKTRADDRHITIHEEYFYSLLSKEPIYDIR